MDVFLKLYMMVFTYDALIENPVINTFVLSL